MPLQCASIRLVCDCRVQLMAPGGEVSSAGTKCARLEEGTAGREKPHGPETRKPRGLTG